jgi:hypothetical protein
MWTADYEADIASDLSAFHRIDDPMTIDGPRYFSLALRLPAYSGVLAARAEKIRQDEREGGSGAHSAAPATSAAAPARVSDDMLIATLAGSGWAEHVTEEEAD